MGIEAILWDMDGVLIDSERQKYEAWKQAILQNNGKEFDEESYMSVVGFHKNDIIAYLIQQGFILPDCEDAVFQEWQRIYTEQGRYQTAPIEPSIKLLQSIRQLSNKPTQAIVSSDTPQNIQHNIQRFGIDSCFDLIISAHDMNPKPAPDAYLKAARELSVEPRQCLVVEDTRAGVEAGRTARMYVVGLGNKWTPSQALVDAGARIVVPRLDLLRPTFYRDIEF